MRQVADKSLCHFLVCYLNPCAFPALFEFLLTEWRKKNKKKTSIQRIHAVCLWKQRCGKWGERNVHLFTLNGLHAHTSWRGFFVIRLNWCRNFFTWDFCWEFKAWAWESVMCLSKYKFMSTSNSTGSRRVNISKRKKILLIWSY